MGLFGSRNKKRGLLGDTMWDGAQTPGYGDGANQHWDIANMPAPMQGAPQDRQPSFWQGGGKFGLRDGIAGILAAIGDGLAQQGGGQGGAVQMLAGGRMDAMDMARKAQAAQMERQIGLQDYEAKKRIDQRYPAPNDTERDYAFIGSKLGPSAADEFLRMRGDPYVTVPLGPNRIYSGPRSGMGAAMGGQMPTAPVGRLTPIGDAPTAQGGASFTPEQYRGLVQRFGSEAAAQDYLRRNGLSVGGY